MTEKDFIVSSINNLVTLFPNTIVRYENHILSNTHFVEVVPNKVYRLNDEYQKWEEEILFQFIALFPTQNLCFISDDAIVGLENIDYEIKGKFFAFQYSFNASCYQTVPVRNFNNAISQSSILGIPVSRPSNIYSELTNISLHFTGVQLPINNGISSCLDAMRPAIENVGNTQYAMAA